MTTIQERLRVESAFSGVFPPLNAFAFTALAVTALAVPAFADTERVIDIPPLHTRGLA